MAIDSLMSRSNEIVFASSYMSRRRYSTKNETARIPPTITRIVSNVDSIRRKVRNIQRDFESDKDALDAAEKCISGFLDIVDACKILETDIHENRTEIIRITKEENFLFHQPSTKQEYQVFSVPDLLLKQIEALVLNISTFLNDVDGSPDRLKSYVEFRFPREISNGISKLSIRSNIGYEFRSKEYTIEAHQKKENLPSQHTQAACYAFDSIKQKFEALIIDLDCFSNVDQIIKNQVRTNYENYCYGIENFSAVKADIDSWSIKQSINIFKERSSETSMMLLGTILTTQEILFAQFPDWVTFKQRTGAALSQDETRKNIVALIDEIIVLNTAHAKLIHPTASDVIAKARDTANTITVENNRPIISAKEQSADFLKEVVRTTIEISNELKSEAKNELKLKVKNAFKGYLKGSVKTVTGYLTGDLEYLAKLINFFSDDE